jgi:PE-PPE domain/PE family
MSMTSMIAQPQLIATAAADAAQIGSTIDQARAAAAGSTTSVVAAAEDEVSAITAKFFAAFGQDYQAMLARAANFNEQFAVALSAAEGAYVQAEAEAQAALGLSGTASASPVFAAVPHGADPTVVANLIMTGSGTATPSSTYMTAVYNRYLSGMFGGGGPFVGQLQAVSTAEGLYPFTGVKDLTLDISLARGVTELNNAIVAALGPASTAKVVSVLGYSQSSIIASLEMPKLIAEGYNSSNAFFTLLGDPANPNGGLLSRFPGLSFPSLGVTFGASTPSNDFPTTIWSLEYDGFADFPRYPIDVFSDLNALAGIVFVHGTYPSLTGTQLSSAFQLPQSGAPSMTMYNMIPTENLPLLTPLRAIPLIGNPFADLIQPDRKAIVNWGYGDPNFGWSTSPADIQTPFGFLPPLSATQALGPLLVSGTQQGVSAFVNDMSNLTSSLPGAASSGLGALTLPASAPMPTSVNGIISSIEAANNNIVGTLTGDFSTAYATLLPTADIATAVVVTLPSYDVNLFLNGIGEAFNGNVVQGLMDAFGDPIAANVGLATLAGGFEVITIVNSLDTILTGTPNPGPF